MKVSKIKIAIKNSFALTLTLFMQEIIQIGAIKVVRTIKRIEIPSTPNLNLIELFIQFFSSKNWKSDDVGSKEYQINNDNKKAAKLLKREIYTALLLFLLSFDKKIKKELTKGKNINVDKIGKFILI